MVSFGHLNATFSYGIYDSYSTSRQRFSFLDQARRGLRQRGGAAESRVHTGGQLYHCNRQQQQQRRRRGRWQHVAATIGLDDGTDICNAAVVISATGREQRRIASSGHPDTEHHDACRDAGHIINATANHLRATAHGGRDGARGRDTGGYRCRDHVYIFPGLYRDQGSCQIAAGDADTITAE